MGITKWFLWFLGLLQAKLSGSWGAGWSGSMAFLEGNGKSPCNSATGATTEISHRNSVAAAKVLSAKILLSHQQIMQAVIA